MITTRKGYRKSKVAKKYAEDVLTKTGKLISLRQARKETAVIQVLIKILKPLTDKQRNKVVQCVKILGDL